MIFVKIIIFTLLSIIMSFLSGDVFDKLWRILPGRKKAEDNRHNEIVINKYQSCNTTAITIVRKMADGFVLNILVAVIILKLLSFMSIKANTAIIICLFAWLVMIFVIRITLARKLSVLDKEAGGAKELSREKENCNLENSDNIRKIISIHGLIFLALLFIQIAGVYLYQIKLPLVTERIAQATRVAQLGQLDKSADIMNLWGAIASLLRLHPLTLIYGLLPVVVISFYYLGYFDLLLRINRGDLVKTAIGLITISVMNIWGYQSDALLRFTLLTGYFECMAFILHGLMPFILKYLLIIQREKPIQSEKNKATDEAIITEEDYQEEWDMKKHKIINARNLAIMMGLLALLMLALVFVLNNKINTLHDSTVNLQRALNERCAVYEFAPTPGKVEGYLLQGSDGSLTMMGGGSEENAQLLYDFLEAHGTNLSAWYLYGTGPEDVGALAKCVNEMGVSVDETYILDRVKVPTGE